MKKYIIILIPALVLVIGGLTWLRGQGIQTITTPTATPGVIVVNTPTQVKFTINLSGTPSVIPASVNLLRLSSTGTQATVATMKDDGTSGDAVSGDKVFTAVFNLNEAQPGTVRFQVSAAFPGQLKRVQSPILSVPVWQTYQNNQLGFQINVPATLTPRQSTDPVVKQVVFLRPPGTSEGDVMFLVEISNLPQGKTLVQAIQAGGIDATSINRVNINGLLYLYWFSPGQGDGNWSYATLTSQNKVISISTPSSSFASDPEFLQLVASLKF